MVIVGAENRPTPEQLEHVTCKGNPEPESDVSGRDPPTVKSFLTVTKIESARGRKGEKRAQER